MTVMATKKKAKKIKVARVGSGSTLSSLRVPEEYRDAVKILSIVEGTTMMNLLSESIGMLLNSRDTTLEKVLETYEL